MKLQIQMENIENSQIVKNVLSKMELIRYYCINLYFS